MTDSVIQKAIESKDPGLAKHALREIEIRLCSPADEEEKIYLLFSRANCYLVLGSFDDAREALDVALEERRDESSQTTFDWMHGLIAQEEGKYADALERYTGVLTAHAAELGRSECRFLYEDIQARRGSLSVTLRRFQEAIPLLQESLSFELSPGERSSALAGLGLCYLELKEYDSARDRFLEAKASGVTSNWKWQLPFYLGIAYYYKGMLREAKGEFLRCEELAAVHAVPVMDMYSWLSATCKHLGEISESARYAGLSKCN
jgi:tetratricopeptide (TPR) repeat protein